MRLAAVTVPALVAALLCTPAPRAAAADPAKPLDPQAVEFFEKKIRPVLTQHCAGCHSADAAKNKKLKGNLYLDTRAGVLKGGDSGPALVPGKPAESLLLKTLKYDGDTNMPPKGKLPDAVVKDFETWIATGAPDPRGDTATGPKRQVGLSIEEGRKFWAYKLPVAPPIPKGTAHPIDALVLAKLEKKGLKPAPEADRATLVRRLYCDLIGLPPSPEEVDAFVTDTAADAYEKLVDKLLASPRFGERWGRHWLDVARFAESVTLRGFVFKEAWRYRDYVIDSFNADLPFDRFIKEQIAGDLLPAADTDDRARKLVATTFLQLGNTNLEEQDKKQLRMDVVDEQLDVITKGFLGQTVTCARCHDHKFDPIPTKDYYALAGILRNAKAMEHANVSKWVEVPLPAAPEAEAALKKHDARVAALAARVAAAKLKAGPKIASGVLAVKDVPGIVVDDAQAKRVGEWTVSSFNKTYIGDGYVHDKDEGKGEKTLTFQPESVPAGKYEVRLAYSPGTNRAEKVPVHVFSADGEKTVPVDMKKNPPIDGRYVSLGEYRFEKGGQAYVIVSNEDTKGHVCPDAVVFVSLDKKEQGGDKKDAKPQAADEVKALEAELKKLVESGPKRDLVMSVVEEKVIEDAKVHVRGNVHNLTDLAPRGFLTVALHGTPPAIPKTQSGRKELADWIASKDNPLTARVAANRVWYWLTGEGVVRTLDNFGTTGEPPSNPELLDHLALTFDAKSWSVKELVRYVVLSRTYRQSATGDAATVAADPENRLFGRANRRRLEAECIRDAVLAVGGQLDLTRGGPTFAASLAADYGYKTNSTRRSVYLPQFRNALPEMLEVFDAADPSTVTGKRNSGTVAPQALFMMNHPFVLEQSKHAAARLLAEKHPDDAARVTRAYRLALGRAPTAGEREIAQRHLKGKPEKDAWTALFHALFASAEFRYVN
jgi:mono/diheme cytochrome c family protein